MAALQKVGFPVELYRRENEDRYRAVVLQKRFDGEHQALAQRLRSRGVRVALDLCDNYLYAPDNEPKLAARAEEVRRMLDLADAVTVSTGALAEHMPHDATVIRDGLEPDSARWRPRWRGLRKRVELIWFGVWGNAHIPCGMRDLALVGDALADLAARTPTRLTVVSNSRKAFDEWVAPLPLSTRYVPWRSHGQLCALLRGQDACLIPVQPNPFSICKSPNRLTLSLSLGVPVIATGIPSYREFEAFCTLDDWEGGLRAAEVGGWREWARTEAGRNYVRDQYGMARSAEEWKRFFESLLGG